MPLNPLKDPTRRGRLLFWLAPAGLLCIFPLFFIGGPGWSDGPLFRSAWNLGHPLFFALLTLALRPWRFMSGWKLWALASAIVLFLGLGIEYAQSFSSRGIDPRDLLRNLIGLWLVLALRPAAGFDKRWLQRDWLMRAFALGLLTIDLVSVSRLAVQQVQVSRWLPDLYDFRQADPETFWQGEVATSSSADCGPLSDNALTMALTTRRYSGAALHNFPSDWRNYDQLSIVIWNPETYAIPLTLRINDRAHEQRSNRYEDRFNQRYQIKPGVNRIQQSLTEIAGAPASRSMDMDDIRRLMFFTSELDQPAYLCLGSLRLQSSGDAPDGLD